MVRHIIVDWILFLPVSVHFCNSGKEELVGENNREYNSNMHVSVRIIIVGAVLQQESEVVVVMCQMRGEA